jgi:DNA-binding response OmpR family regulator
MPMTKVLLIDDDRQLAGMMAGLLAKHGYELNWHDTGRDLPGPDVALVLLDVMLPERDGFEVCRAMRARGDRRPVIMLTGKGDPLDRVTGLKAGADDYLPKPFNPQELLARMEALLRRTQLAAPPSSHGNRLDVDRRSLFVAGREIALTPSEYRLLRVLTAQPGRTCSRSELINALDEDGTLESFDRAIDLHMSRLRLKIEPQPKAPQHLITVRGVGYRLTW